jgi:uncharacterized membrane protein
VAGWTGGPKLLQTDGESLRRLRSPAHGNRGSGSGAVTAVAYRLYFDWLIPVSLVVGLYLRTREWLFDKSLWLDELMVTYNFTQRGYAGLLRPLSFNQAGPVGWLWAERASVQLFGMNDMAVRFPEWLASIIALGLFPLVARRLVSRAAVPAATVIIATSPMLIYWTAETKQYSFDVACTVLALLVTTSLAQRRPTWLMAVTWGLTCAALVWCSQPAIAVCAVCAVVLLVKWCRHWRTLLPVVIGAAILGASIAADWAVTLKNQSANSVLQGFWRTHGGYPPLRQTITADLHWLGSVVTSTGGYLNLSKPYLAIGLMACGLIALALSRHPVQGLLLVLPLAAAVALAVTDHYPFARRLALYLYPVIVMLLVAPLAVSGWQPKPTARWLRPAAVAVTTAALLTVTASGIALGLDKAIHPDDTVSGRQSVAFVAQHQHRGDLVLGQTGAAAVLTMAFYGPHYHVRERGLIWFADGSHGTCKYPFSRFPGVTRVWLVMAELSAGQPLNRNQLYLARMAAYGKLVLSYTGAEGAGAYLFDIPRSRAGDLRRVRPAAPLGCLSIRSLPPWLHAGGQ